MSPENALPAEDVSPASTSETPAAKKPTRAKSAAVVENGVPAKKGVAKTVPVKNNAPVLEVTPVQAPEGDNTVKVKAKAKTTAKKEKEPVANEAKSKKEEPKQPKLIRDSFTFPDTDYALIGTLKQRAMAAGQEIKKSELLRAGLAALQAMPDEALVVALAKVERIKIGRPKK